MRLVTRRALTTFILSLLLLMHAHGGLMAPAWQVMLDVTWDDPHGGHLTETFEVDKSGNKMTQTSEILVNEDATTGKKPTETYTYYSVYKRVE